MEKFDAMMRRDDLWFQIAIGVACLVFFTVTIGTLVAFFAGKPDAVSLGARVDIVYKLGLIGAGLITFCTVAWRGLLATQQVDAQRKQIEKLTEQITATTESNLASLLQKGAELISDDKLGKISAGIATLQAVVTDKNPKFAKEAMDVLADFIQSIYPRPGGALFTATKGALLAGNKIARRSDRQLRFITKEENIEWVSIFGVRSVRYEGGKIRGQRIENMTAQGTEVECKGTEITGGNLDVKDFAFSKCLIVGARIRVVSRQYFSQNVFKRCDFTGTEIDASEGFRVSADDGNWFTSGKPPIVDSPLDLTLFIERPSEGEFSQ